MCCHAKWRCQTRLTSYLHIFVCQPRLHLVQSTAAQLVWLWTPNGLNFLSPAQRDFQNRRLSSRGQAMGHQEEPPGYELWQTESLYTPVLQERHHSEAWCVTQTGLPVRQPCMIKRIREERAVEEPKICWTYSRSNTNSEAHFSLLDVSFQL